MKEEGKDIGDILVLIPKTLAIRNVLMEAINSNFSKVIIESDSIIAIQAIKGESIPPKDISNQVYDIIMLAKKVDKIFFVYYRRSANELTDRIAKETIYACTSKRCP